MQTEDKKVIKNIMHHKDLERNLSIYTNSYMNEVYEYSLIHFMLSYYTIKEVENDTGGISIDETLDRIMNEIHTLLYRAFLADEVDFSYEEAVTALHTMRNTITQKMKVLTAYTDALQLYEYILNRVEYKLTGATYEVEPVSLAAKVFKYLFADNDKMLINSKIQLVTSQLPIRMTKSKFYEYLTDTLNIYNGSDRKALDDFIERLLSTALLKKPKGYGNDYPEIVRLIHTLETVDYKELNLETYQMIMEQFAITTNHLTELVSNYLLVMELVNAFYTVLLVMPYEKTEKKSVDTCIEMLRGLHDSYISGGKIPDSVNDGFMEIEGIQEELGEDIVQFEAALQDIQKDNADLIESLMLDKMFHALQLSSKLLSNSLFIDLEEEEVTGQIADTDYITGKRDELVELLSAFFKENQREMNRAVMSALFSGMPVLFNSQEEVKNYIENSLSNCNNESELMACAKILEDLMAEE